MKNSNPFFRLVCLIFLSASLISCGGGGGGGGGGLTTPTISFSTAGTVTKYLNLDTSYSNAATTNSTGGSITYSSSAEAVATVDSNGTATIASAGTTTITATIAANGSFSSASASYSLVVESAVAFNAWIGASDTEVELPTATSGMQFYSSTDQNDVTGSFSANLTGTTLTDTSAKLNTTAYYALKSGQNQSSTATVSLTKFSERRYHQLVAFNDKMWLIAGDEGSATKDVWSSSDGKTWTDANTVSRLPVSKQGHQVVYFNNNAGKDGLWLIGGGDGPASATGDVFFSEDGSAWGTALGCVPNCLDNYANHQAVAFQSKLWLIGGRNNSTVSKDVWWSSDGSNWTEIVGGGNFSARQQHRVVFFNDKLWLIGGLDGASYLNDIWTFDGTTWTEVTATTPAPFDARADHELIVFNNKLWLMGGRDSSGVKTDFWSSADGTTWTQESPVTPFPALYGHAAVVFDSKLWLVAGNPSISSKSDQVWSSSDGINWKIEHHGGDFSARQQFGLESLENKLWVIAGDDAATTNKNDVWSSSDAVNWSEESSSAAFDERTEFDTTVFNNKVWLSGGSDSGNQQNREVWSYDDSAGWQEINSTAAFPSRFGHQMVTFNNEMWVLGGHSGVSSLDDNWSSADGEVWALKSGEGSTNPFVPAYGDRRYHQAVVYNNKLWVIGGELGNTVKNDVWSSDNGVNWTEETGLDIPSARTKHQVVVFNDAMWLIGGAVNGIDTPSNNIYKYTTASGWSTAFTGEFSARHSHRVIEHDGELYLIGGVDGNDEKLHDVWKSSDGTTWRHAFSNTIPFQ